MSDDLVARLQLRGKQDREMPNHYVRRMEIDRLEAAKRIEALEAKLQDTALDCLAAQGQAEEAYQAQLVALEALELADAALSGANINMRVMERKVKAAIAKLKGEKDD